MTELTDLNHSLARQIRQTRDNANLTQAELAEHLGVSLRTLQNWEAGTSFPRAKHRRVLATFMAQESA